jgi:hypothetical protein
MNLNVNGQFAQQVVSNYLSAAALDALLANPFRTDILVLMGAMPLAKECNSLETRLAHKIAAARPDMVLEAVLAFNGSQKPQADGTIWRARYDTRYGVVRMTRSPAARDVAQSVG